MSHWKLRKTPPTVNSERYSSQATVLAATSARPPTINKAATTPPAQSRCSEMSPGHNHINVGQCHQCMGPGTAAAARCSSSPEGAMPELPSKPCTCTHSETNATR